jgi:hypothetical protein
MSEWIDLAIYGFQIVLIWVLLPRQSVQYTVPAIVDRDPAWPAAHPEIMRALARSRWFLNTFYAWAALSIGVLLALRLGLVPVVFGSADVPSWERLKNVHGAFLIVGMIGYFACFWYWTHWLAAHVPLAAQRRATLKPRVASDYVPRGWRIATEVLTGGHLALWIVAPALGFGGNADYWGTFAFVVTMTVLFAVVGHLTPRRRPNYADRLFGDSYRRVELRVMYALRLAPLVLGALTLGNALTGLDFSRPVHLLLVLFVCALALAFLRLRPAESDAGTPNGYAPFAPDRRSAA